MIFVLSHLSPHIARRTLAREKRSIWMQPTYYQSTSPNIDLPGSFHVPHQDPSLDKFNGGLSLAPLFTTKHFSTSRLSSAEKKKEFVYKSYVLSASSLALTTCYVFKHKFRFTAKLQFCDGHYI